MLSTRYTLFVAVLFCATACGAGPQDSLASTHGPGSPPTTQDASARGGGPCRADSDCASQVPPTAPPGCAAGRCDVLEGTCTFVALDRDGDGHAAADCASTNGVPIDVGDDCNDEDAELYPGHSENCSANPQGTAIAWPTGAPTGICEYGQVSCLASGAVSACMKAVPPGERDCASADDNDCDGKPDDEECGCSLGPPAATRPCFESINGAAFPTSAMPGKGPCQSGVETCVAINDGQQTTWGTCVGAIGPQPSDTCDPASDPNSDADCDGVPDEGCSCINGTSKICNPPPACNQSSAICAGGTFPACPAAQIPTDDGATLGSTCTVGVGACQAQGTIVCLGPDQSGNYSATCSAVPGTPSTSFETSPAPNGSWDWNCDGTIEGEYPVVGPCPPGFNCACVMSDDDYCGFRSTTDCTANNPTLPLDAAAGATGILPIYLVTGACNDTGAIGCGVTLQVEDCSVSGDSCVGANVTSALCGFLDSLGGVKIGFPCSPTQGCQ
ncbi:MAG TPA: hypothetical protein VK841_07215 [Polyangiaceae bacterium]|nr:hypothetical protein [Polyangiaceae bacterium]